MFVQKRPYRMRTMGKWDNDDWVEVVAQNVESCCAESFERLRRELKAIAQRVESRCAKGMH
jgi:hypothetical protein